MGGELKRWEFTGTSCGSYESPRKEPEPSCPNDPACPKGQYCRFSGTIDRAGGTFYVHMCECATPIYG